MDSDDELAEIRRRKMQEMQRSAMDDQASAEEQRRAQELEKARKQQILRQILTPEARERLSRVRLVKPELADNVEQNIVHGSDAPETAATEIAYFFSSLDLAS